MFTFFSVTTDDNRVMAWIVSSVSSLLLDVINIESWKIKIMANNLTKKFGEKTSPNETIIRANFYN